MLTLYKVLINALYICLLPYFRFKGFGSGDEWRQRRAIKPEKYIKNAPDNSGDVKSVWMHASSMGEVRVLQRLVTALKKRDRHLKYYVSTYTKTGNKLARELFDDAEAVFFFPLDCYWPLKRLFAQLKVDGVAIVETEIWPYFLTFCNNRDIPLVLANGRLTERSTRRYRRFRGVLRQLLLAYRWFLVQTEADAERMVTIGANADKIQILGNIKNDPDPDIDRSAMRKHARDLFGLSEKDKFVIFASTRPGEEEIICRTLNRLAAKYPDTLWLLAPRHLERLQEVRGLLAGTGCEISPYSEIKRGERVESKVILMDRMGVLADLFYGADISFVGGTLTDLGGHNVMEPVLAGSPVLFGPSVFNVKEAATRIVDEKFGKMVGDEAELEHELDEFLAGGVRFNSPDASGPSVADKTAEIIVAEFFD